MTARTGKMPNVEGDEDAVIVEEGLGTDTELDGGVFPVERIVVEEPVSPTDDGIAPTLRTSTSTAPEANHDAVVIREHAEIAGTVTTNWSTPGNTQVEDGKILIAEEIASSLTSSGTAGYPGHNGGDDKIVVEEG